MTTLNALTSRRLVIKISGESGQGINSVGEMMAKAIKESGFFTFGYREYPSLIKGGYASHQVEFSDTPLLAPSQQTDFLLCFSRVSFHKYLSSVRSGGQVIHMLRKLELSAEEKEFVERNKIEVFHLPAETLAQQAGGKAIMANVVMVGALWQLLGLAAEPLQTVLRAEFAHKPEYIESNLKCLAVGLSCDLTELRSGKVPFKPQEGRGNDGLLTGNHIIALGAVAAGVRAYYAYPMTPSSSILSYLAQVYHQTGMLVKQVDDEISVAQMAIGSMFVGTRALVGTSGGGFDLMTESVSLAAMTETPFVCILAQRPGPATGLPTWTSAADLNLAIYSGHGEFARCVVAASDPASTYLTIQHAFNLAEEFQIPVIVLTEKQIAESLFQMSELPKDIPIQRHLVSEEELLKVESTDRFKLTDSGISPRWLPGQSDAVFVANSDEHTEDGSLTEEAAPSQQMYDKRLRKQQALLDSLPQPELIGPKKASFTLVGWGSVRNTLTDIMPVWNAQYPDHTFNYLHYEYVYPLHTEKLQAFISSDQPLLLIENNATGQLGGLITQTTGFFFKHKLLKYDGRPFFVEEVWEYLEKNYGKL
jgi:2-oxoglutarate/2-oxoacid ferredoxin oxidoreductase subunit alpha